MNRNDLERLNKDELIELVVRLQRPEKTSRNSSKPPSTDRKEKRENSKPGGDGIERDSRGAGMGYAVTDYDKMDAAYFAIRVRCSKIQ